MKARWIIAGPGLVAGLCLVACSAGDEQVDGRNASKVIALAKGAAQAAFESLSGELGKAIAEGGTTRAIPVCSSKAGSLTARIAEEQGVEMKRLSDRPRNPGQRATGEDLAALESMRADPKPQVAWSDDGSAVVRLPIVINNALCLKCHGGANDVDAETREALATLYPEDEATGYSMDDLRGIWRIEVPPTLQSAEVE
ncbi:DUF3365 domain-containing protein [Haloferula sp. A504]|uniref:DUF3365 domain-containing protein n=1 Tax=Haloferula sp. A504 TaxID=3373601 RepID=UPI0031C218D8|nr:DUF3365 domain-containing protein [Verrucomicrobiaceae bacterium E54]